MLANSYLLENNALYTRRVSDVIDVTDNRRRHVGGIGLLDKDCVKCGNFAIVLPRLFVDRAFWL